MIELMSLNPQLVEYIHRKNSKWNLLLVLRQDFENYDFSLGRHCFVS